MLVRRVTSADWRELRGVRLRALESDAAAFSTSYSDAAERPDRWWRDWCERSSVGDQAIFMAWIEDRSVGMVGTFVGEEGRVLFGMWVDPGERRHGVGRTLAEAVRALAHAAGDRKVLLSVRNDNLQALALYERVGYERVRNDGNDVIMSRRVG